VLNLKIRNPELNDWDDIRYWVDFEINGQKMQIGTTWNNGKCSLDDVIAHRGYSSITTVPTCSYCGKTIGDCEICPEFYFNQVKTQLIVDQIVHQLHDKLKELPFDFENPFINSNRGQRAVDMIKIARSRGHKILAVLDGYNSYIVSGSVIAPEYTEELFEDDDMFFMKSRCTVVDVSTETEKVVSGGELGNMESEELSAAIIPEELLDRSNTFVELELEWKREMVLETLSYVDDHRRNTAAIFLKRMLEWNFPKQTVSKFLEDWISVDMLEDSVAIQNQFIYFTEDEGNEMFNS
jgi:hypothetical protein